MLCIPLWLQEERDDINAKPPLICSVWIYVYVVRTSEFCKVYMQIYLQKYSFYYLSCFEIPFSKLLLLLQKVCRSIKAWWRMARWNQGFSLIIMLSHLLVRVGGGGRYVFFKVTGEGRVNFGILNHTYCLSPPHPSESETTKQNSTDPMDLKQFAHICAYTAYFWEWLYFRVSVTGRTF